MKHLVYLRSGKVAEVDALRFQSVDHKNQIYKFYDKVDEYALNEQVVFIANNPDAIKPIIHKQKDEKSDFYSE